MLSVWGKPKGKAGGFMVVFSFEEFALLEACLMSIISPLTSKQELSDEDVRYGNLAVQTLLKVKMLEGSNANG